MKAEVVVCGAGITAVYHLSKLGIKDILLVDPRPPLTFTSDKSSESYRNFWPSQTMAAFMDHSIGLLADLAQNQYENADYMRRLPAIMA